MLQFLKDVWQFLTDNKDPLDTLLKLLTFLGLPLGAVFAAVAWLIRRRSQSRLRVEVGVFEVLADPATLLAKLYGTENNNSPLADHNIPYHPRDPDRDLQVELRRTLHDSRYLLITARTGLGKTREAATLAASLMLEGWRVVRVRQGWIDRPKEPPPELHGDLRRVLILLDDLNRLFSAGGRMQSPKADQAALLGQPSYHDRLLAALDDFEAMCGANEIRVIATARDETDEWQKLDFNPQDRLWKRFVRFELPQPGESVTVELLKELTALSGSAADAEQLPAIARTNDGTFMNVVLNLQRLKAENKPVTLDNYRPTLTGSWHDVYRSAARKHTAVQFIYDAIDILRQCGISLYPPLVELTARELWGGNALQRLFRRYRLNRALRYLTHETKMLTLSGGRLAPHDGQIEAKGTHLDRQPHTGLLVDLVLRFADRQPKAMLESLLGFGIVLYIEGQLE